MADLVSKILDAFITLFCSLPLVNPFKIGYITPAMCARAKRTAPSILVVKKLLKNLLHVLHFPIAS